MEEKDELKNKSPEYRAGFTAGSVFAYVVCACACAIVIAIAAKLVHWIWML